MSEAANNERLSIYIDDAISTILEVKLNRIVPPTLQTMVNNKFNEAPTWFTSEMNNIKSGLTD
ncbi:DEHA2G00484p [Debaryomyces hansenii CBS767]|uniref:DEHA2G00484p n=1 Tax=Debaryomyces hansenii (strain ATCC 36239 / CBS 767 / BCRC 21394 / JCM 1990 / NBRC 0083 / IGC 2968) TaxID=284592 RepID=Q6BJR7_DEBHA|nr:DEHA2G00484p [Debaryomyces hansenii CBS767]CAG89998.1 DEHA2G00484p [Debaryomyces hansenii CBS767]|eukprot:XP_461554.1 DEHA2G00484p [Debaryomyces hansenii CBS767]